MKMLNSIGAILILTVVGCGETQSAEQQSGSAQPVSEIISQYSAMAVQSAAASAGAPNPYGLGDIASLSDEELLAKFKVKLIADLERLEKSVEEAKARGVDLPPGIEEEVKKQRERVEEILARLDSDSIFREMTLKHLRTVVAQPHTPESLPDFCERIGQLLEEGKVPEQIRSHVQEDYDQKCSATE